MFLIQKSRDKHIFCFKHVKVIGVVNFIIYLENGGGGIPLLVQPPFGLPPSLLLAPEYRFNFLYIHPNPTPAIFIDIKCHLGQDIQ